MKHVVLSVTVLFAVLFSLSESVLAQCATGTPPTYPSGCTDQYFTSVTASGTGVVSTIGYTGSSCAGIYFNYFTTEGVTAPTGSTVNISISREDRYQTYLAVYVDWNNNGMFEPSELAGSIISMPIGMASTVYSFNIPLTGIVTNTNLYMRVFLGEPPAASGPISSIDPPCSARWGQANDYYLRASCTDPTLSFLPTSPTVCGSFGSTPVTVSGAGAMPTYEWTPATGLSASTGATVTATPGVTRTYSVTGYGPGVCANTNTVTVTVSSGFTPVITPSGPTTFCPGGSVTLNETSGVGVSYQWYRGGAPVPGATNNSFVASPIATTTYSVAVTDAIGCVGAATQTVTILPAPAATISPAGPVTVCSPASVPLTASGGGGYTYRWYNGASVIPGATNRVYTATGTGNYSVEITAPSGCTDVSAITSVNVNATPTATVTASGSLTFCSYESRTLSATAGAGYTYQWMNGLTPISGATNAAYVVSTAGTYDYRVIVSSSAGCSDTSGSGMSYVTVNPAPVSDITISGSPTFCTGGSVLLSTMFVSGYSYQWYGGASVGSATPISGATAASYVATVSGYYYVVVTTPSGCTTNSSGMPAVVSVVDFPEILHSSSLRFCWGSHTNLSLGIPSSATGVTYQWQREGVNISGATSNNYDANLPGNYTCVVNIGTGCSGVTAPVAVAVLPLPDPIIVYSGGYLQTSFVFASYQWYLNSVAIPGATSYRVKPTTPGEYSVIVSDGYGCVSDASNYTLTTLVTVGIDNVSPDRQPLVYPNPAKDILYVQYSTPVDIVISGMDGKQVIRNRGNSADLSKLSTGVYMVSLYNEKGIRIGVERLVKE